MLADRYKNLILLSTFSLWFCICISATFTIGKYTSPHTESPMAQLKISHLHSLGFHKTLLLFTGQIFLSQSGDVCFRQALPHLQNQEEDHIKH